MIQLPAHPPALRLSDGAVEVAKWAAALLMLGDHFNKYVLGGSEPVLYAAGRVVLPLFACVLAWNLARTPEYAEAVYRRVAVRLAIVGAVASVPFIALGGLGWGWWPLNVMFTLLLSVTVIAGIERGGWWKAGAALLFVVGGALVEFWWSGIAVCVLAFLYFRRPRWITLAAWVLALASLWFVSGNGWALLAIPVLALLGSWMVVVPRVRWAFYVFYPVHLTALWAWVTLR